MAADIDALAFSSDAVAIPADDMSSSVIARNDFPLSASLSASSVREDNRAGITLTLRRNPRDTAEELVVRVLGDRSQLSFEGTITIPAGQAQTTVRLVPVDDLVVERTESVQLTFSAPGHRATSVSINIVDNETPKFQNPKLRFDVNNDGIVSAVDALLIVNQLVDSQTGELDPADDMPDRFLDVNGDYQVSAIDALNVINEIARDESSRSTAVDTVFLMMGQDVEDDDEDR